MYEATEVVLNYTAKETKQIVNGYLAGKSVEALAVEHQRGARSIIAKLVSEGVYKRAGSTTSKTETKKQLVKVIATFANLEEDVLTSLEKADKAALEALVSVIRSKMYAFG